MNASCIYVSKFKGDKTTLKRCFDMQVIQYCVTVKSNLSINLDIITLRYLMTMLLNN